MTAYLNQEEIVPVPQNSLQKPLHLISLLSLGTSVSTFERPEDHTWQHQQSLPLPTSRPSRAAPMPSQLRSITASPSLPGATWKTNSALFPMAESVNSTPKRSTSSLSTPCPHRTAPFGTTPMMMTPTSILSRLRNARPSIPPTPDPTAGRAPRTLPPS